MEAPLVAQRTILHEESSINLTSTIPNPFPIEALRLQNSQQTSRPSLAQQRQQECVREAHSVAVPITVQQVSRSSEESNDVDQTLLPSLHHLQQACLTALNNLFSRDEEIPVTPSSPWTQIVPTRRHSLPDAGGTSSSAVLSTLISTTLNPLQTLVSNLRSYDDQLVSVDEDGSLMEELARRVSKLAPIMLDDEGAELAASLVTLLSDVDHLSSLHSTSSAHPITAEPPEQGSDVYDTLSRRVLNLQLQRSDSRDASTEEFHTPSKIERDALWSRIDEELETVLTRCRHRANRQQHILPFDVIDGNLPPEYDPADYQVGVGAHPPEYDPFLDPYDISYSKPKVKSATHQQQHPELSSDTATSEKMRLDLESVAMAIDRLYLVAPQLHNQRVELKKSKLQQMDAARRWASADMTSMRSALEADTDKFIGRGRMVGQTAELPKFLPRLSGKIDLKGKGKALDPLDKIKKEELEKMVDLIGKTSNANRRISDQRVEFGDMNARIERSKRREEQRKEAFVDQLLKHSAAGRLSSQDAIPSKTSALYRQLHPDPETLLSLPEFIREELPPNSEAKVLDPNAMLTLPEFFQEQHLHDTDPIPHDENVASVPLSRKTSKNDFTSSSSSGSKHPSVSRIKSLARKPLRSRSNSAPPLALSWFKPAKSVTHSTISTEQSSLLKEGSPRNSDVSIYQG
ncbi:hypothetical protein FRC03_008710 [Tulasnella sp. 419]|nr:hypothetical protein FRC03_008710 [Tulasnella sp. 419]